MRQRRMELPGRIRIHIQFAVVPEGNVRRRALSTTVIMGDRAGLTMPANGDQFGRGVIQMNLMLKTRKSVVVILQTNK